MRELPQTGDLYRHFKNKMYQIVAVARHSETGEDLVIYQALYGDYSVYARPLDMFQSEVDHVKYPDVTQRYRFERVDRASLPEACPKKGQPIPNDTETARQGVDTYEVHEACSSAEGKPSEESDSLLGQVTNKAERVPDWLHLSIEDRFMNFLDAKELADKQSILASMRGEVTDQMITSMAVSLDVVIEDGPIEKRYEELMTVLRTRDRYENSNRVSRV